MATSVIAVSEGNGKNIATHSISESAVTKELQRIVNSSSDGSELAKIDGYAWVFSTDKGTPISGIYEATPTTVSDGQVGTVGIDRNRNLKTTLATGIDSLADSIVAKIATDAIMNDNTEVTPVSVQISTSATNNQAVAAITGKKIRVIAATLSFSGTVNAKFQSGSGGTDISPFYYGVATTQVVLPFNPTGWFDTAVGAVLNVNCSAVTPVGVLIDYIAI